MLLKKLDASDLQSEKMATFDGAMVYAQNKRQQVVLTEYWAKTYPDVHISCMHPGMEYGCFFTRVGLELATLALLSCS